MKTNEDSITMLVRNFFYRLKEMKRLTLGSGLVLMVNYDNKKNDKYVFRSIFLKYNIEFSITRDETLDYISDYFVKNNPQVNNNQFLELFLDLLEGRIK